MFYGRCELDTHTDAFVVGRNCLQMHFTERICNVKPYSDEYEAEKAPPTAQVATGYTTVDGNCFILIMNETLWFPNVEV